MPNTGDSVPIKVLLVEDDVAIRISISSYLEDTGFLTVEAKNGREGLDLFNEVRPDIVLTDLRMPNISGFELLEQIASQHCEVPVIVISGTGCTQDVVQALRLGAWNFITKPISDMGILEHVISQAMEKSALIRENRQHQEKLEIEVKKQTEQIRILNADLEKRVVDRTHQLQCANDELRAFAYSVSHDLRAPLRHIDGFSQILREEFGDKIGEEGLKYLDRVCEGAQTMQALIADLLTLFKITSSELSVDTVDLTKIATRHLEKLKQDEPTRQIDCSIETDLMALGDSVLLENALANLLDNAWKYTGKNKAASICVGQKSLDHCSSLSLQNDDTSIFYVKDNGVGFDMKFSDKLFGPFQRLHHERDFKGTGIGLATVKRIINRHGGSIWAEAKPDEGATFYFTLGNISSN